MCSRVLTPTRKYRPLPRAREETGLPELDYNLRLILIRQVLQPNLVDIFHAIARSAIQTRLREHEKLIRRKDQTTLPLRFQLQP